MGTGRQYDEKFKVQAVKLAKETGTKQAAEEPGIPKGTLGSWVKKAKDGEIDIGIGNTVISEQCDFKRQFACRTCNERRTP